MQYVQPERMNQALECIQRSATHSEYVGGLFGCLRHENGFTEADAMNIVAYLRALNVVERVGSAGPGKPIYKIDMRRKKFTHEELRRAQRTIRERRAKKRKAPEPDQSAVIETSADKEIVPVVEASKPEEPTTTSTAFESEGDRITVLEARIEVQRKLIISLTDQLIAAEAKLMAQQCV